MKTKVAVSGRRVKRSLDLEIGDEHLTSHGGLSVLEAYLESLSVRDRFDARFGHLDGTGFTAADTLSLLLASKIVGDERMSDLSRFRDDAAVKEILGLPRIPHPTTTSRLLGRMTEADLISLQFLWAEILRDQFLAGRRSIIVDVDSTPLMQWGNQEGAAKGYCPQRHGAKTYNANMAFDAKTGMPLFQTLRSGNQNNCGKEEDFCLFLDLLFGAVLRDLRRVIFRADSGYFAAYIFDRLEKFGAHYVISARGEQFPRLTPGDIHWCRPQGGVQYGEFSYAKDGWISPRRFVIKRDLTRAAQLSFDGLWDTDVIVVTNQKGYPKRIIRFYNDRGTAEQYIAEGKQNFAFAKFPSGRFLVNQIDFVLKNIAMGMLIGFRDEILPSAYAKHRPGTIRKFFVNVAAKLVRTGRRKIIRFTKAVGHRAAWEKIFARLGRSPPVPA